MKFHEFLKENYFNINNESENDRKSNYLINSDNKTIIERFVRSSFDYMNKWEKNSSNMAVLMSFLHFYEWGLKLYSTSNSIENSEDEVSFVINNYGTYRNISIIFKIMSEDITSEYSQIIFWSCLKIMSSLLELNQKKTQEYLIKLFSQRSNAGFLFNKINRYLIMKAQILNWITFNQVPHEQAIRLIKQQNQKWYLIRSNPELDSLKFLKSLLNNSKGIKQLLRELRNTIDLEWTVVVTRNYVESLV